MAEDLGSTNITDLINEDDTDMNDEMVNKILNELENTEPSNENDNIENNNTINNTINTNIDTTFEQEISNHFPDVDRQHLMLLVRKAQRELSMAPAESRPDEESSAPTSSQRTASPTAASKALFSYLKTLADQHLTASAKQEFDA